MNASTPGKSLPTATLDPTLETVELELALGFVDFEGKDFEEALRPALDAGGATLLFTLPAPVMPDSSKVAAINMGSGFDRRIFIVVLGADGRTPRIVRADDDANPFAPLAASFCRVMEQMPPLAA